MSRIVLRVLLGSLLLGPIACGEPTPTRPSQPLASRGPASSAALTAQINGLINALFAPKDQGGIFKQFAQIKSQLASGKTADAQASIVAFVQMLLTAQQGGVLQDPNGAQPPTIADALRDLVNSVAQLGGLPPPLPGTNPFAGDGAIAVVGSAGGTVVSSTGFGGVGFPPGALPADVIVVISRLPNPVTPGAGPLPTTLTQFPLYYDFSTVPAVTQFAVPVTVGICQLEVGEPFAPPTQAVANRLQLAHPNPANPTTIELLERTSAGFVNCNGITLSARESGLRSLAARALDAVGRLFRPSVAYAVHGGLGGKTTSFSPFGAVDPTTVPGGVTSGLRVWLRADLGLSAIDGAPVLTWADQSGNGNNATWSSGNTFSELPPVYDLSNPAVAGKPAVRFNGQNALELDLTWLAGSDYTIIAVNGRDRFGVANFYVAGDVGVTNRNLVLGYELPNLVRQAHFNNDLDAVVEDYTGIELWSLDTYRFAQSEGRDLYHNGAQVATDDNTVALISNTGSTLGHFRAIPIFWFAGDLAEVLVYNRALSSAERLSVEADLAGRYGLPLLSNLAERIVYVGTGTLGDEDLYTVLPDGSQVVAVNLPQGIQSGEMDDPAWHPTHTRIVIAAKPPAPNNADYDIFAVNPDGTGLVNLTNTAVGNENTPSFSPDGSKIAFAGDDFGLRTMNADGSGITLLTALPAFFPNWSPDGLRIVFGGNDVYVMPSNGSTAPVLIHTGGRRPRWSPDGSRILFEEFDGISTKLFTMNPDGTGVTLLAGSSSESYFGASWSPSGTKVAFMNDSSILHVVNADGTGLVSLGIPLRDGGLAWR